jgi:hypothetical protein
MLAESMNFSIDCQMAHIFCQQNPNTRTRTPVHREVGQF